VLSKTKKSITLDGFIDSVIIGSNKVKPKRHISEEHRKKISQALKGENNPNWHGGKRKHSKGYVRVLLPSHPYADKYGYVFEHRLIMEKYLGRYLQNNEHIHHINNIKNDNRLENLQLMTIAEHSEMHFRKSMITWWENKKRKDIGILSQTTVT
jgi:HNH endonuclease/NUMOD3 motif-containing protein